MPYVFTFFFLVILEREIGIRFSILVTFVTYKDVYLCYQRSVRMRCDSELNLSNRLEQVFLSNRSIANGIFASLAIRRFFSRIPWVMSKACNSFSVLGSYNSQGICYIVAIFVKIPNFEAFT